MPKAINPYIAGNPVGNSDAFIGRADIVREALQIFARPEENAIVLYGQRRIGKTSVLQFLKKTLAEEKGLYFPVYFDLQDKATFSLGDVLKDLAMTIAHALGSPAPQLGDDPVHSFQHVWLPEQLERLPKGAALVLLFDEFDVLAADSAKGAGADFFPYLRQLIASDRKRLNFVFVIGRNVNDLNTIALSLFKSIQTRRISLLNKEDCFDLIRLSEKTSPLRWNIKALERIWQLTHGHAFFTQQLCSFAWEEAYDDGAYETEEIGLDIVESIIDNALDASRNAFEWLWDGLPPAERVVSAALAQVGDKSVTEAELEKLLHESGVRIVIRELQDAPKLLQDWDLLEPVNGDFRFRVELLRRWIEQNKPLRRVQDELDRIQPVAENLFQAAQGLYLSGQLEQAEVLLQQAIGTNPNHVKANRLLADIFLANKKYLEAKNLLSSLYEYQPVEAKSRLIQAWLGLAATTDEESEKLSCYEAILKIDPNQAEANKGYKSIWESIGERAEKQGELSNALNAYRKSGDEEKVTLLTQEICKIIITKGLEKIDSLKQEKKYDEALYLIQRLEKNVPEILDKLESERYKIEQLSMITVLYQQALDAINADDKKKARALLVKVINVDPEFEDVARYFFLLVKGIDYNEFRKDYDSVKQKNKELFLTVTLLEAKVKMLNDEYNIKVRAQDNKYSINDYISICIEKIYYICFKLRNNKKIFAFSFLITILIITIKLSIFLEEKNIRQYNYQSIDMKSSYHAETELHNEAPLNPSFENKNNIVQETNIDVGHSPDSPVYKEKASHKSLYVEPVSNDIETNLYKKDINTRLHKKETYIEPSEDDREYIINNKKGIIKKQSQKIEPLILYEKKLEPLQKELDVESQSKYKDLPIYKKNQQNKKTPIESIEGEKVKL